jgi:DNA invertase Pin-like site-specific DNA recombinase
MGQHLHAPPRRPVGSCVSPGRLLFNFLGTIAEYFLDLNRERTLEGLKAAAARGRKGGRRRNLGEEDLAMARALLNDPSIPVPQVAKRLGVSRATFYAYFPGARSRSMSGAGS